MIFFSIIIIIVSIINNINICYIYIFAIFILVLHLNNFIQIQHCRYRKGLFSDVNR